MRRFARGDDVPGFVHREVVDHQAERIAVRDVVGVVGDAADGAFVARDVADLDLVAPFEAEADGVSENSVIERLLDSVGVP